MPRRGEAATKASEAVPRMAARPAKESESALQRSYRKFTALQKPEIVLAGLRSDPSIRDACREREITETIF